MSATHARKQTDMAEGEKSYRLAVISSKKRK